jgi:ssDNA-binding Zn-finger/Zn-ribbon topoisomerase 1
MRTKPEPYCPICGAKMILRKPKPGPNMPNWSPFWGCGRYPDCHGKRNIDPETGEPEKDEFGYNDNCNDLYGDR